MLTNVTDIGPFGSKKQFEVRDQNTQKAEIRDWLKDISDLEARIAPVRPSFSHFYYFWENMLSTQLI